MMVAITPVALAQEGSPAFRSNVELVTIPCTVVDANGVAVKDLTRDEFVVYDNGVRRTIQNFWVDEDLPLTLDVLIDASASQEQQLSEHRKTAVELLKRILRPGDRAFVIYVAEEVRTWVDLTETEIEIDQRMAEPPGKRFGEPCEKRSASAELRPMSVCGSSPLWNALHDAAKMQMQPLKGSKALLILTDGFDSGSSKTWRQAADEAAKANTQVYALQYQSGFGKTFAPDLYRLVGETGGTTFRAVTSEYESMVSRLETDLRRHYVVGFRPEQLSGKIRHEVRVEVVHSNLTVRARKTYFYDQP